MNWKLEELEEQNINNRIKDYTNLGSKLLTDRQVVQTILSCIDLTTLEGSDTDKKARELCKAARSFKKNGTDIPNVAAVCFYPPFAALAKAQLKNYGINVACVAGAFPSGQSPLEVRIAEVKYAVEQGADEIDMVISRGKFLEGDYDYIYKEVKEIKEACGNAHLKVILETGELGDLNKVRLASEIAIAAGADFIKTSTGKIQPAATLEAFIVMLDVIKAHYDKTGIMIGIKPAGGISEVDVAKDYIFVLEHTLGEKWMNNTWFRIGASRLAGKALAELM
ncbi:MAG: deoxyribose-phosphate aldolase [Bacteroidales bacterium]|nr:deoxyribose-phosphate aldolase [Bacteroidales bacterium]